ncbi:hypothetical protein SAMN04487969_104254 [Paenibacillus algorifonticola]|uniref:Uncharacterized protein n=1 Tax=Paenibacillus algorifonticola TaxID=684063 RepID=A0A1I2C3B8_9BACL|nr:hypothetical protein [Paenibacillus algorifonticola]SFE62926.1 hypothetical protein SAMN04487969_104254 [Paenibacillus algorifonticola]
MKSEFMLDLCFIRKQEQESSFTKSIEALLQQLFAKKSSWFLEEKHEGELEVVNAAVKGYSDWEKEEEVLLFIEEQAPAEFWDWIQGYRLELDLKRPEECQHCGEQTARKNAGAGAAS